MGDGVHIARFARRRCDTCGHEYNAETESIEPAGDPYGDDV